MRLTPGHAAMAWKPAFRGTMLPSVNPSAGATHESRETTISKLSGCRLPPTASSRPRRAYSCRRKDMHYTTEDGRSILDGTAGLWCVNAGPLPAEDRRGDTAAGRNARLFAAVPDGTPGRVPRGRRWWRNSRPPASIMCSSANSGSESVDTALKIALACHRARGEGHRNVLVGRERGYHGVGFGGHFGRRHTGRPQGVWQHAPARRSSAPHSQP